MKAVKKGIKPMRGRPVKNIIKPLPASGKAITEAIFKGADNKLGRPTNKRAV